MVVQATFFIYSSNKTRKKGIYRIVRASFSVIVLPFEINLYAFVENIEHCLKMRLKTVILASHCVKKKLRHISIWACNPYVRCSNRRNFHARAMDIIIRLLFCSAVTQHPFHDYIVVEYCRVRPTVR